MVVIDYVKYVENKKLNDKNKVNASNCLSYLEGNNDYYFWEDKSPCIEYALIKYLEVFEHYLKESDIEVLSEKTGVDYDNYQFITRELNVPKYEFKVWITARHKNDWYFYVDEVR